MSYLKYAIATLVAIPTTLIAFNKTYNYFNHSSPTLPKKHFHKDVHIFNQNGTTEQNITNTANLIKELIECMALSFCGTNKNDPERFMDWALGKSLSISSEAMEYNYNYEENLNKRLLVIRWVMSMIAHETIQKGNGSILYIRNKNGTIGAASVIKFENVQETYLTKMSDTITKMFLVITTLGKPPWMEESSASGKAWPVGIGSRFDAGSKMLKKFHHTWTNGKHVYTLIMAVAPTCQGLGYCSKVMNTTVAIGNENKMDVYLETGGEKNQSVYRRYGYVVVEEKELLLKNDDEPNLVYSAMLKKHGGDVDDTKSHKNKL